MSEKALRSAVIRLAHAKPELREHLLPLLEKTAANIEDGPVGQILGKYWNVIHDIEYDLEKAIHEYDKAASYRGGDGEKEAKTVIAAIKKCLKALEGISKGDSGAFAVVLKAERKFTKEFGNPDDYADQRSREMFPR